MPPGSQGYADAKALQRSVAAEEAEEEDALLSEVTSLKTWVIALHLANSQVKAACSSLHRDL